MRGNAPQVVEALWAAKEEPPAKLVGFSLFFYFESSSAFLNVSLMVSDGSLSRRLTTTMAMTEKKKPGTSS